MFSNISLMEGVYLLAMLGAIAFLVGYVVRRFLRAAEKAADSDRLDRRVRELEAEVAALTQDNRRLSEQNQMVTTLLAGKGERAK